MLSAVITALLIGVMLLVIASLIINIFRARRRHMQSLAIQGQMPTHPLDPHVKMILHMHEGVVVSVEKPQSTPAFTLSPSWYGRHRTLVSVSFLVMLFLALFLQSGLADGAMQNLSKSLNVLSYLQSSDIKAVAHPLPLPQAYGWCVSIRLRATSIIPITSGMSGRMPRVRVFPWKRS